MLKDCPAKTDRQVEEVTADEPDILFVGHTEAVEINDQWKGNVPRTTSNNLSSNNDVERIELDAANFEPDVKHIELDANKFESDVKRMELDVEPDGRWVEVPNQKHWRGRCETPPGLAEVNE